MEWATEKPADPMEVRVYSGADGNFTLYEDENDNYNYEKGVHATIPFRWDNQKQTLTIGAREGEFPGMLRTRTFQVVFIADNRARDVHTTEPVGRVVKYEGKEVTVHP